MSDGPMPVATDPLGAIRVELVAAARRRAIARRRRRRMATVAATTVATLAMVTGAGALIGGSTGIASIDDFLGLVESSTQSSGGAPVEHAAPRVMPMSGTSVQLVRAAGNLVAVAYVNRDGDVCFAISKPHGEGAGEAREGWGCMAPDALSRGLAGEVAFASDVRAIDRTIVTGFARPGVQRLSLAGPGGPFTVELGGRWSPGAEGATDTRPFVAIGKSGGADAVGDPRGYSIEARMEGGQTEMVGP